MRTKRLARPLPFDVIEELQSQGLSFEQAAQTMVDLVALHELGHVQAESYGIDPRQAWFAEFIASYFAYAYLRSVEPDLAHKGFVVLDQLRTVDRRRLVKRLGRLTPTTLAKALAVLQDMFTE